MIPFRLWAFSLSEGVLSSLKKRFSFYKGGCKKLDVFYSPSKMPVGDSGIFDAILVGFALHFIEISVGVAAK